VASLPLWLHKHTDLGTHDFAHSSDLWQPKHANVSCVGYFMELLLFKYNEATVLFFTSFKIHDHMSLSLSYAGILKNSEINKSMDQRVSWEAKVTHLVKKLAASDIRWLCYGCEQQIIIDNLMPVKSKEFFSSRNIQTVPLFHPASTSMERRKYFLGKSDLATRLKNYLHLRSRLRMRGAISPPLNMISHHVQTILISPFS
jgi:hypothetical protein